MSFEDQEKFGDSLIRTIYAVNGAVIGYVYSRDFDQAVEVGNAFAGFYTHTHPDREKRKSDAVRSGLITGSNPNSTPKPKPKPKRKSNPNRNDNPKRVRSGFVLDLIK